MCMCMCMCMRMRTMRASVCERCIGVYVYMCICVYVYMCMYDEGIGVREDEELDERVDGPGGGARRAEAHVVDEAHGRLPWAEGFVTERRGRLGPYARLVRRQVDTGAPPLRVRERAHLVCM